MVHGNFEAIGLLAHKMKAPIQMIGDSDLLEKIRSLEINCKNGTNLDIIPNLINEVKLAINELSIDIKSNLETIN